MKCVGTGFGGTFVKMGTILGLRVSPQHRRMGIGLKLVNSIEEWVVRNGAKYTFLAVDKDNIASTNLFATKCNYTNISSLNVFIQPVSFPAKDLPQGIRTEKLHRDHAISLYNNRLSQKEMYPIDIDAILKEKMSLGTWASYFIEEEGLSLHCKNNIEDIINRTPSSWAMFSIWNTTEAYNLQIRKSHPFKSFHETLSHAIDKIFPCLKIPISSSLERPFGFLFLYGIYGEGERIEELIENVWVFASRMAGNMKGCKAIMTELGVSDPLIQHIPQESSMSCINDLWYMKNINGHDEERNLIVEGQLNNVFVDPRDL